MYICKSDDQLSDLLQSQYRRFIITPICFFFLFTIFNRRYETITYALHMKLHAYFMYGYYGIDSLVA